MGEPDQTNSPPLEGWTAKPDGVVSRNTKGYYSLPYNAALKDKARKLRKAGNLSEVLLWNLLKNKQWDGLDFDRQKIIGNYIVDFYCANCGVVLEIDGSSHDNKATYDANRDAYLKSLGLEVIHIWAMDVLQRLDGVLEMLKNHPALRAPLQGRGISPDCLKNSHRSPGTPPKEGNTLGIRKRGKQK